MNRPQPEPFFVKPQQTEFTFICPDCVRDENDPLRPDRLPFKRGRIEEEDNYVNGTLPLDEKRHLAAFPIRFQAGVRSTNQRAP